MRTHGEVHPGRSAVFVQREPRPATAHVMIVRLNEQELFEFMN